MASFELICPAGTLAALRAAVDAGADSVYVGFRDETNARNFPGLNFSRKELAQGVGYAHARGKQVFVAINTYPTAGNPGPWHRAVDDAADNGADAVILADVGLLDYAARSRPKLRLHLSVQASAANPEAIGLYRDAFGVRRVVLPRVLTINDIAKLNSEIDIETEVFVFGGMCPMAEGRCSLSSYATGRSPNRNGVCSPASHVRYETRGSKGCNVFDWTNFGFDLAYFCRNRRSFLIKGSNGFLGLANLLANATAIFRLGFTYCNCSVCTFFI